MFNRPCKKDREKKKKTYWHFIAGKAQVWKKTLVVERENKTMSWETLKCFVDLRRTAVRFSVGSSWHSSYVGTDYSLFTLLEVTEFNKIIISLAALGFRKSVAHLAQFCLNLEILIKKTADLIFIDPFCVCISKIKSDVLCWKGGGH